MHSPNSISGSHSTAFATHRKFLSTINIWNVINAVIHIRMPNSVGGSERRSQTTIEPFGYWWWPQARSFACVQLLSSAAPVYRRGELSHEVSLSARTLLLAHGVVVMSRWLCRRPRSAEKRSNKFEHTITFCHHNGERGIKAGEGWVLWWP